MNKKKRRFGINIGSSSILMIFVILCLVSFAVLSIVSAQADYKLSQKLADKSTAYYTACNEAETFLQNLTDSLKKIYTSTESADDYFAQAGKESSFSIPISSQQLLEVKVSIQYPPENGSFYRIESWQVTTLDTITLDDTLPLLGPEDFSE